MGSNRKVGMRVIFRYELYDMTSGKRVTDREGATTKVQLAANQTVDGYFAPRGTPPPPPDAPWTWAGVWNIPTDFPLGNVVPSVLVTAKDGKSTTLKTTDFAGMPLQIVD